MSDFISPQPLPGYDDISIGCDEGQHPQCSGVVYGTAWSPWPPVPTTGRCLCACHATATP